MHQKKVITSTHTNDGYDDICGDAIHDDDDMISLEVSTQDDIGSVKKLPLEEKNRRGGRLLFQFPPPKHH